MARLYGVSHVCSHGTVTEGFRQVLMPLGLLEGFVDLSFVPRADDPVPGGALSPDAIYTGPLGQMEVMRQSARHVRRWVMVAPNGSKLPTGLIRELDRTATDLLAPSEWAATVLRRESQLPVLVVPHGVSDEYFPVDPPSPVEQRYPDQFLVVHFSTSDTLRKGTRELVEAWRSAELGQRGGLLALVLDDPHALKWRDLRHEESIHVMERYSSSPKSFRHLASSVHLIAQPSRGEGFGLVPLEARCCGCPVLMSAATGHAEHVGSFADGCQVVPHGPEATIDEAPGATAPTIAVEDLTEALLEAHAHWRELKQNAVRRAASLREEWKWQKKLQPLVKQLT